MDTLFFILSKLLGFLVSPASWIIIAVGAIALAVFKEWRRVAKALSLLTFVALMTIAVFPIGDLLLRPLEGRFPAGPNISDVDGIIVLGGSEDTTSSNFWQQPQLNESAERLTAVMALARRFPKARIVFSGGSGRLRDLVGDFGSEANVAASFFADQGLDVERLTLENASRNTTENARMSSRLLKPHSSGTWILVTSAFHMERALQSFEAAGWTGLVPYPVDYRSRGLSDGIGWNPGRNLAVLHTAVREWVGLLAYRIMGR